MAVETQYTIYGTTTGPGDNIPQFRYKVSGPNPWKLTLGMVKLWRQANPHVKLDVTAQPVVTFDDPFALEDMYDSDDWTFDDPFALEDMCDSDD